MDIKVIFIIAILATITIPMVGAQIATRTLEEIDTDLKTVESDIQLLLNKTSQLEGEIDNIPPQKSLVITEYQIVNDGNFVPSKRDNPHMFQADCGQDQALSGRVIVLDPQMLNDFELYQIGSQNFEVHRVIYEFYNNSPNEIIPLRFISECRSETLQ